jgi:hypothetical protein
VVSMRMCVRNMPWRATYDADVLSSSQKLESVAVVGAVHNCRYARSPVLCNADYVDRVG